MSTWHNVILFGESGSGKSSIVNMIVGEDVAQDTRHRGVNEGDNGRVLHWKAVQQLYTLIRSLDGVSLLIYCMRGRIKENTLANWTLFNKIVCNEQVPIIVVVTGLEHEENLHGRATAIKEVFNSYKMSPKAVGCITSIRGRMNEHLVRYDESRRLLRDLIKDNHLRKPWTTQAEEWMGQIYETTFTTKLCFFPYTRLEFVVAVGTLVDQFVGETRMKKAESDKLKTILLRAEKGLRNKEKPSLPSRDAHNVIIFGESGAGKSSVVNMIVGKDVAKVSNSPTGCTFESKNYETRIDDVFYRIYDTAGLNEGDHGRVPHWKAIQGLYTLIRQVDGVSLLVFCMKGRMKGSALANWLFFFDAICGQKVPIIAVVTGLEQEENLDEAEKAHMEAFTKNSMFPKEVACVVSIRGKGNAHEEQYKLSQQKVRSLIVKWRKDEPWGIEKDQWFSQLFQRTYELKICMFAKSRLQFGEKILGALEDFRSKSNLVESDIDRIVKGLIEAEKKYLKGKSSG